MSVEYSIKKGEHKTDKVVVPIRASVVVEEVGRKMVNCCPNGWFPPFKDDLPLLSDEFLHVELIDSDDEVIVKAVMPGVHKDDVEVTLTDRTVTIRGSIRSEEKQGEGETYRHEICTRTFRRTDTLPAKVDDSNVRAIFKDGVLEVYAFKLERSLQHPIKID